MAKEFSEKINSGELKKNAGGRPSAEIDQESFEKLCAMQCTRNEICAWFGITDKTLSRWCEKTYGEGFSATYEKTGAFLSEECNSAWRRSLPQWQSSSANKSSDKKTMLTLTSTRRKTSELK